VKHTAWYFHQYGKLADVLLGKLDFVKESSSSGIKTSRPKQTLPDHSFKTDLAFFLYEEWFLLEHFYQPVEEGFMELLFESVKTTAPLHLLISDFELFDDFKNSLSIKYGTFASRRHVNGNMVRRILNPPLNYDVVPKTKLLMKSDAATIANILAQEPRILSNIAKRSKNTKIECNVSDSQGLVQNGDALYVMLHQNQSDLQDISAAFQKLYDRLKRNARTMLSGKSGEIFNKFSQSIGLGQDNKYVICFHDPNKAIKLMGVKKDSQKLANIHVAASNLKFTEGSLQSIQPIETIVGKGKTTSFCPKIVKLVQTYSKIFDNNGLVLFDMKTQRLGYAKATREVLLSLTISGYEQLFQQYFRY